MKAAIAQACRMTARSAAELVPVLFSRQLDPHQMSFAFSETQAHVNYMLRRGELTWIESSDHIERVVASVGGPVDEVPLVAAARSSQNT
jgi:prophage DNA circulation protein